jgi:hypothetical protein
MESNEYAMSNLQILQDFAKRTGRKIIANDVEYSSVPVKGIVYSKRMAWMPYNSEEEVFLVACNDMKDLSGKGFYFGVFISLPDVRTEIEVTAKKRDVLDRINPFAGKDRFLTSDDGFNKRTVVSGNVDDHLSHILNNRKFQEQMEKALNIADGMMMGVNYVNLDFVPALKGKSVMGFFVLQQWFVEDEILEQLLEIGKRVHSILFLDK